MGFEDTLRKGVAILHKVTKTMQSTITWYAWTGQDDYAAATFADGVELLAFVDTTVKRYSDSEGEEVTQTASVTIVQVIPQNATTGRQQPIDPRDKIVLNDGTSGQILTVGGPMDPELNVPYALNVTLGN